MLARDIEGPVLGKAEKGKKERLPGIMCQFALFSFIHSFFFFLVRGNLGKERTICEAPPTPEMCCWSSCLGNGQLSWDRSCRPHFFFVKVCITVSKKLFYALYVLRVLWSKPALIVTSLHTSF